MANDPGGSGGKKKKGPINPGGWPKADGTKTPSNRPGVAPSKSYGGKGKANSSNPRSPVSVEKGRGYTAPPPIVAKNSSTPAPVKQFSAPSGPVGGGGGGGGIGPVGTSAPLGGPPAPAGPPAKTPDQIAAEGKQKQADQLAEYMKTASGAVQAELMPALNDLNRQIEELNARANRTLKQTSDQADSSIRGVGELYRILGNTQGRIQDESNAQYGARKGEISGIYDQLTQQLGTTFDAAQGRASAEANRLGIGGMTGVGEANALAEKDQQYLQGLAGVDKAAGLGRMGGMQQLFDQYMGLTRASSAATGTMQQGGIRRDADRALSDIRFELEQGNRDLSGQRGDIEATRGEKIRQTVEALQERDYSRGVEQEQMRFERELATAKFDLEKRAFEMSQQPVPPSQAEILDLAIKQAELDKRQIELDTLSANGGVDPSKAPKVTGDAAGRQVLEQSLSDPKARTDMWNIIRTLQNGDYDDYREDPSKNAGKFDLNDQLTLKHLREAIARRFPNNQQESLDVAREIIRAILGN